MQDGVYDWGYDPKNYFVPEGSYATDPYDPAVRIREFKQMVRSLHRNRDSRGDGRGLQPHSPDRGIEFLADRTGILLSGTRPTGLFPTRRAAGTRRLPNGL